MAAECWDRWLEAGIESLRYRRELRALRAQVARLQGRLRYQHRLAHSRQEPVLPNF